MTQSRWATPLKFGVFAAVMVMMTAFLFAIFGQYRTGSANEYSAAFVDISGLKQGDTVRVAGVRVGTVNDISMRPDKTVVVTFDSDRNVVLTSGTRVEVRYLNLVGDRYLELLDGAGSTALLPGGSQIPVDRTASALDLDLLLGGLRPVIRGLNPQDINALSGALIEILQGQGDNVESLFAQTSSFTNTLAEHRDVVQQLIVSLRDLFATLSKEGDGFSATLDRLQEVATELSAQRNPIGDAIEALNQGTASLASLLTQARPPLAETVTELNRLAPALDEKKDRVDTMLGRLPEDYQKLARIGSYGSFINYYVCSLTMRATDLQGRTAVFPVMHQEGGRCAEPE